MYKFKYIYLYILIFNFYYNPAFAFKKNLNVSIAYIPGASDDDKHGFLIDLVKKIDVVMGTNSTINVYPFARSLGSVAKNI
jgi:hypothetical protein